MSVQHVCQWGYWGATEEESCGEANVEMRVEESDEDFDEEWDEPDELDHSACGWYTITSVDSEFDGMAKSLVSDGFTGEMGEIDG